MRTTVTLDSEVERLVEAAMHRERKSFKQVVNEGLRRGLAQGGARKPSAKFRVAAHHARLLTGIDRRSLNRMADDLEEEAMLAGGGRRRD